MCVREFRQPTRTKKVNRWRIWRDGAAVSFQDGLVGGKLKIATTHSYEEPINKGKANEKSPEQQAIEFMERQILLKTRKGYREVDAKTGKPLQHEPEPEDKLTQFELLPTNLRFYKPVNSVNAYMQKMMEAHTALWLRKRDGCMHVYVIDKDGNHRMYSSTLMNHHKDEPEGEIIHRYPHIEEAFQNLQERNLVQPNSIFLGEICCVEILDDEGFHVDSRDIVNGVRGGLNDHALELQEEHGKLGFCIWDIAFWNKDCLMHVVPNCDRFGKMIELAKQDETGFITFPELCQYDESNDNVIMDSPAGTFWFSIQDGDMRKTLLDLAKDQKWEGWVVVDPEATYDDRAYNFRGKADRPKTAVKDKPKREADFIVRYDPDNGIGKRGKGKKSVGVGSVQAYLWHPEKGEVPVSLIGGGLDDEQVLKFADPKLYPMVWQVEFEDWTKAGSLTHPRLVHVRDDKTPEECEVSQNPDWEEHYG